MPPNRPKRLNIFLGKITRCTSVDRLRSRLALKQRHSEYALALDELKGIDLGRDIITEKIDVDHLSTLIEAFLDTLSVEAKNFFVGRYFFMDSIKDIARITNSSESKIKTSLYRIRMELKEYLEKEGVEL